MIKNYVNSLATKLSPTHTLVEIAVVMVKTEEEIS